MVRNYKKKGTRSGEINEEMMSSAIRDVLDNKLSIRKSAQKYAVKPSTLESRITIIRKEASVGWTRPSNRTFRSKYASYQVFSNEEESLLNNYIIDCSKMHYGLTCIQVRKLAYEYAKANSLKYPSKWDENMMAGKDWLQCFRKRNINLSLRKPENTSAARSFRFNKKAVDDFYQNLENIYGRYKFTANRIYNFDESGISTVLKTPKVLADRSQKQIGQLVSAERGELVTFGGIISASGNTIPPLFVFPRVHFRDHFIEGSPEGSMGVATKSGWINSSIFIDVLKHIQKFTVCSKENPILLLCDNHESHVTLEAINYSRDNGIIYLSFPPHTTHRLQPLDIGVFGPFKSKLKIAFNDWHVSYPGKTLNIYNIPKLAKLAYFDSFTAKNITSAFGKAGIWPFNKLNFSDDDFTPIQVYQAGPRMEQDENVNETTSEEASPPNPSQELREVSPSPVSQPINEDVASVSKELMTPEMVRPFPKIERNSQSKRGGRQPGKSRIYTDTPEKNRLEDIEKSKEEKRKEQERKAKAREMKRAVFLSETDSTQIKRRKKNKETRETYSSDDETDIDMSLRESSTSSIDEELSLQSTDENDSVCSDPLQIIDDSFVLVKFEKKKTVLYYVGKVLHHYGATEYKVSFLRKKRGSMSFVFPDIKDDATVYFSDVVLILPSPKSAATARTAHIFNFSRDLSKYYVQ